jgi:hypothetical protein
MRASHLLAAILLAAGAGSAASALDKPQDPALVCNGVDAHDGLVASTWVGGDIDKLREAEFFFSADSEKSLTALDAGLHELGFATRPSRATPGLVATIDAVVNDAWLRGMMPKVCKLATHLGVDFDGWDSGPAPQKHAG